MKKIILSLICSVAFTAAATAANPTRPIQKPHWDATTTSQQSTSDLYYNGSRKGELRSNGDVYINGSRKGEIRSNGDIYVNGSRKGEIRSNGDIYKDGRRIGEVRSNGDIYYNGRRIGEARNMTSRTKVAVIYFFGFFNLQY